MKIVPIEEDSLSPFAILVHLGLVVFGITALLTGEMADDYKQFKLPGFFFHSRVGIGVILFVFLRLVAGILGSKAVRFSEWVPYTRDRLRIVFEDVVSILKLRIPERGLHQGLSGLVQTFGLLVFLFMAVTGALMLVLLEPSHQSVGFVHSVKEAHEIGIVLIPVFLLMHGGAAILHALRGHHIWKKMVFLGQ